VRSKIPTATAFEKRAIDGAAVPLGSTPRPWHSGFLNGIPESARDLFRYAGWRTLLQLLRGLLAEVPLQVGEVALGGSQFDLGVAEPGLCLLDSFHDP